MDHRHVFFFDPVKIKRKQIGPKAVGHAMLETGRRVLFIGAEDPATTLFAHIPFGIRIPQNRVLGVGLAVFHQRRVRLGHDELMLDRDRRHLDPQQLGGALRMISRRRHHMLGANFEFFLTGDQVATPLEHPSAAHDPFRSRPVITVHLTAPFNRSPQLTRALGHGLGHVGGVDIAVGWMENRSP